MIDAWCLTLVGGNAPRKSAAESRCARPVAMAYLKICPQLARTRCAVSSAPRFSIRLMTLSNSGAVMVSVSCEPNQGNISTSSRLIILLEWFSFQFGACLLNHSRATLSKLFSVKAIFVAFWTLFISDGSAPFANILRAASRRSRASDRLISG